MSRIVITGESILFVTIPSNKEQNLLWTLTSISLVLSTLASSKKISWINNRRIQAKSKWILSAKHKKGIHVFSLVYKFMCPEFWVRVISKTANRLERALAGYYWL